MKRLYGYKLHLMGLAFAVALVGADVLHMMSPCGFKWGG